MNIKVIALLAIILCSFGIISCNRAPANPTVVLVVRHAEKVDESDDPPLTEAGRQRAQSLVHVVEGLNLGAIYSSQYKRVRDTVQPLADSAGVAITVSEVNIDSPGDYGKRLADQIIKDHSGQTVVVANHRNTIAAIAEALSGKKVGQIEDAYSYLFIIIIPPGGEPRLIKAKYGN